MKHRKRSLTPILTTIIVLAFFYLPILMLVIGSFNAAKFGGKWKGFTYRWYVGEVEIVYPDEKVVAHCSLRHVPVTYRAEDGTDVPYVPVEVRGKDRRVIPPKRLRYGDLPVRCALADGGVVERKTSGLWQNEPIRRALENTLIVGLLATLVSTIVGTIGAFALHRFGGSRIQRFHSSMVWLPLMVPEILMGLSLLIFFGQILGWTLGRTTMVIAHVTFCVSYVIMVVRARLQDFDSALLEASLDLGATWWQTTWKVLVPVLLPGIAAGALLAFTLSIDDYVISFFVNGKGMTTLPIQVQGMMKRMREGTGVLDALSTLMILLTFILLVATQLLSDDPLAAAKGGKKSSASKA